MIAKENTVNGVDGWLLWDKLRTIHTNEAAYCAPLLSKRSGHERE
jgi:hypothetical protein